MANQNRKNHRNDRKSNLTDVSALGLVCKTCHEPIKELPFTPQKDTPLDCMSCHKGGEKQSRPQVFTRGEQLDITFGLKEMGGVKRPISILQDGTVLFRGTRRFQPTPNKSYPCSVVFHDSGKGKFGLAIPSMPYRDCTPKEWLPPQELRTNLIVTLTFQERRGSGREGLIAFDEGQAVFPERGTEDGITPGKPVRCLLREAGRVAFALPVGDVESKGGNALMKLFEDKGEVTLKDLGFIVLKTAKSKGAARVTSEKDVEIVHGYRSVYELLSDADEGVVVSESSTEDEINKAYRRKAAKCHTDAVALEWRKQNMELPFKEKLNSELFMEALLAAKTQAIESLARRAGKGNVVKAAAEASAPAAAPAAQKDRKSDKRDRKPRQPKEAKPATAQAEAAPVEGVTEVGKVEVPTPPEVDAPAASVTEASAEVAETHVAAEASGSPEAEEAPVIHERLEKHYRKYGAKKDDPKLPMLVKAGIVTEDGKAIKAHR